MILLSNEVIIFLFVESLLLLLLSIAFINTLSIYSKWDFNASTSLQYRLEKRAYLVVLIIVVSLGFKILLLPYFSFMIDQLSAMVPGAMCGAGVLSSNEYGSTLLSLKVVTLFLTGAWLILNSEDIKAPAYPYFKIKLLLFIMIYLLVVFESALDILYLINIPTGAPVACCSSIYGAITGGSPLPFNLDITRILILFYLFYLLSVVSSLARYSFLNTVANLLFLYIAYFAVVYFFGTYIYELPTHQCPFCMLQAEYYYVGYVIWGTLFLGSFFGISAFILKLIIKRELSYMYRLSLVFNTLFVSLVSVYVLVFYLKNGVLL